MFMWSFSSLFSNVGASISTRRRRPVLCRTRAECAPSFEPHDVREIEERREQVGHHVKRGRGIAREVRGAGGRGSQDVLCIHDGQAGAQERSKQMYSVACFVAPFPDYRDLDRRLSVAWPRLVSVLLCLEFAWLSRGRRLDSRWPPRVGQQSDSVLAAMSLARGGKQGEHTPGPPSQAAEQLREKEHEEFLDAKELRHCVRACRSELGAFILL